MLEVLGGKSAKQVAKEAVASTKLMAIENRKRIAGSAELARSEEDGMLRIVRILEPEARKYRKMYEDQVQSRQSVETARIAQAQYSLGGNVYPDATFTMRVSFGPVIGYKDEQGKAVEWKTDFAGMYRHATGVDPLALPPKCWSGRSF